LTHNLWSSVCHLQATQSFYVTHLVLNPGCAISYSFSQSELNFTVCVWLHTLYSIRPGCMLPLIRRVLLLTFLQYVSEVWLSL